MTIRLHLPPGNHAHLLRAVWRVNRGMVLTFWTVGAVVLVLAAVYFRDGGPPRVPFLLGVTGVALLVVPTTTVWRIRRRLAKLPDEPGTVTINEERIFVVSPSANVDFSWTLVSRVQESRDAFILRQGALVRAVLPKAEFVGDDLATFRRFLADRRLVGSEVARRAMEG